MLAPSSSAVPSVGLPWPAGDVVEPIAPAPTDVPEPRIEVPRLARRGRIGRRARVGKFLPSAPALFPWLERRLAPGEATILSGPSSLTDPLLEMIYAGNALVEGRISLIEGANRFQPYRIGERGRSLDADPANVLDAIRLARAFTAYQLVALVDGWSAEIRRHRPTLLIAHELPALFFTEEVPESERAPLLTHVAERLQALLREHRLPLVMTLDGGFARFPGLRERGPLLSDLVRFHPRGGTLLLESYRENARLSLVARRPGQRGLEEFGPKGAEEVAAWVAPSRRTGRRSRSG